MKYLHRFALVAISASFFIAPTQAQTPGAVTNHAFAIGKGAGTTGYGSVLCSSAQVPVGQTSADPQCKTLSGDVTNDANGVTAIGANKATNAKINPGAANTVKGTVDGLVTSDLAVASCSALYSVTQWVTGTGWQCGINPVLPSRAVAATLNLSAFTSVKTLGYATAGDGGEATFLNRTTTPFRDSFVTAISITGNGTSGCTNGTYRNKQPSGGTGTGIILNMVVSGNVVTSATIEEWGGNGYTAADVLTTTVTGCSTSVTLSVTTVSTPTCSFSDSTGNHLQIIYSGSSPFLNPKQCGAKFDYAGTDGSATNDFTAIQNTISYCADIHSPTIDGGGSAGCRIMLPPGNAMICGGVPLNVPQGVSIEGVNMWGSTIKICAAWGSSANFMNICDPDTQASCFSSYLRNFTLYAPFTLDGSSGVSAIYSNSIQQVDVIDRVAVYAGRRRCITLETGYGGAALLGIQNFECTPGDTSTTNVGMLINYGTTIVTMRNVHVETSGPNTMSGITINGGFVNLIGFHTEGISTGIEVNITGSIANGFAKLDTLTGGASCTNLVLKQGGSVNNTVYVSSLTQNGCTNSINDEGAATTTFVGAWTLY
jgi:hypothetical protein